MKGRSISKNPKSRIWLARKAKCIVEVSNLAFLRDLGGRLDLEDLGRESGDDPDQRFLWLFLLP